MANNTVLYEVQDRIAIITLNRPQAMNAMNEEMLEGIRQAWIRFNDSDERCAIIRGAGGRAFSTGLDVKAPPKDIWRCLPSVGVDVEKPIIAAIDGHCIGGGYVLMAMCDLAVATERSSFAYSEAKLGYTGGLGVAIAARVPQKIAMEILLVGEAIQARRAYEVGLINQVVPQGEELKAAMRYAAVLAENAPLVMQSLKAWYYKTAIPRSQAEISGRTQRMAQAMERSADFEEGRVAFREKRKARFEGR